MEGQSGPGSCTKALLAYELNATTQAKKTPSYAHPRGAILARTVRRFALRTRMKEFPPRQLAFVRLTSAFLACRCFNLLVLRSHRPRKC